MRTWIFAAAFALASCAPVAHEAPPAAPAPVAERPAPNEDGMSCAERGGSMQPVGRRQTEQCVVPFADAGKPCTDGSQCASGRCIDEEPQEGGASRAGVCQRTNFQFGCFATVSGGRAQATICVD